MHGWLVTFQHGVDMDMSFTRSSVLTATGCREARRIFVVEGFFALWGFSLIMSLILNALCSFVLWLHSFFQHKKNILEVLKSNTGLYVDFLREEVLERVCWNSIWTVFLSSHVSFHGICWNLTPLSRRLLPLSSLLTIAFSSLVQPSSPKPAFFQTFPAAWSPGEKDLAFLLITFLSETWHMTWNLHFRGEPGW